jgi:hypothetical protein
MCLPSPSMAFAVPAPPALARDAQATIFGQD